MIVLGINSGISALHHDPSVVIVEDGKVLFAAEEERYSRVKFGLGQLPIRSIKAALEETGIRAKNISMIAHPGVSHLDLSSRISGWFDHYFGYKPAVKTFNHQLCHVASAYFASGFDHAIGLSLDGFGDNLSGALYKCEGNQLELVEEFSRDRSLGHLYATITSYLGFNAVEDEYKVMGLAPYGDKLNYDLWSLLEENFVNGYDQLSVSSPTRVISRSSEIKSRYEPWYTKAAEEFLGPARAPNATLNEHYYSIAFTLQKFFQEALIRILETKVEQFEKFNLVYAGGCALNCTANFHLSMSKRISGLFIQPAASDRGISLGAAYLGSVHLGDKPKPLRGSYSLGSQYTDERIELALKRSGIPYCKLSDDEMIEKVALKLKEGKIVGWFQGRSEFGPRALGSRSILADATNPNMKQIINSKVKFREEFRPFAPMMLRKNAEEFFKLNHSVNYEHMVIAAEFKSSEIGRIRVPAVWHPNNLGRVQLVADEETSLIGRLLREVDQNFDMPCLLNTSFNTAGEPLVETPEDAIATFVRSGIDLLTISRFIVEK